MLCQSPCHMTPTCMAQFQKSFDEWWRMFFWPSWTLREGEETRWDVMCVLVHYRGTHFVESGPHVPSLLHSSFKDQNKRAFWFSTGLRGFKWVVPTIISHSVRIGWGSINPLAKSVLSYPSSTSLDAIDYPNRWLTQECPHSRDAKRRKDDPVVLTTTSSPSYTHYIRRRRRRSPSTMKEFGVNHESGKKSVEVLQVTCQAVT